MQTSFHKILLITNVLMAGAIFHYSYRNTSYLLSARMVGVCRQHSDLELSGSHLVPGTLFLFFIL